MQTAKDFDCFLHNVNRTDSEADQISVEQFRADMQKDNFFTQTWIKPKKITQKSA